MNSVLRASGALREVIACRSPHSRLHPGDYYWARAYFDATASRGQPDLHLNHTVS